MWIIIYSCSFNRVKARHSALWYRKSSRRSSGSRRSGSGGQRRGARRGRPGGKVGGAPEVDGARELGGAGG